MTTARRLCLFAALACAVPVAGCTGNSPGPAPHADMSPAVELTCADAGSGSDPAGAGDLTLAGLTLEGLAGPAGDVPTVADTGAVLPGGADRHFRKAPAWLAAGAGPVTVELTDPAPGQVLAWVPAAEWSGRPRLGRWTTTAVTLDGCPDRAVTYFGGLLAGRAPSCLHLRVRGPGGRVAGASLRLDGRPC